jgi:hypothetical protein
MADAPTDFSGRCLCGNVTYRATSAPVMQGVCHCTDCQRQTGTAYSMIVAVPRDALTIEGDTLASHTTIGEVHQTPTERKFCSACGSPIASFVEGMPELAFIKAGTLDDASWFEPAFEIWTRSAQPWTPHFEGIPQLERAPASA